MNLKLFEGHIPQQPPMQGNSLTSLVLLQLYLSTQHGSVQNLAKGLQISPAYASMLLRGERSVSVKLVARLHQLLEGQTRVRALLQLVLKLETYLGRSMQEAELLSLIPNLEIQKNFLNELIVTSLRSQTSGFAFSDSISHEGDQNFDVASALSGLTSLADILVEEPDLPHDQRQQFQKGVQSAAQRLKTLLTNPDPLKGNESASNLPQRADRYVDQVFLDNGYYFEDLECEADLIVRRARRHGPLGTFALVARLEHDLGRTVSWVEDAGMAPSAVGLAAIGPNAIEKKRAIELDPSLGQAQLRFRLSQFLVADEAEGLMERLIHKASPPTDAHAVALKKALVAYTAAAMFMPYEAFLQAAQMHRYDIDWLARHFGCSFDQVCHRLVALRKPGMPGVPFGMLRVSPAGQTITRIALPGLALPDRQAGCPLWAAYGALQRPGETLTQLAEFPNQNRFLFIGRTAAGPRAHYGQPRRLTSVMLACDWAYADALIYADSHDPGRQASVSLVGSSCITCSRSECENRVEPQLTSSGT